MQHGPLQAGEGVQGRHHQAPREGQDVAAGGRRQVTTAARHVHSLEQQGYH
jgi:hypothetical protein